MARLAVLTPEMGSKQAATGMHPSADKAKHLGFSLAAPLQCAEQPAQANCLKHSMHQSIMLASLLRGVQASRPEELPPVSSTHLLEYSGRSPEPLSRSCQTRTRTPKTECTAAVDAQRSFATSTCASCRSRRTQCCHAWGHRSR